jgi:hypothetical protein
MNERIPRGPICFLGMQTKLATTVSLIIEIRHVSFRVIVFFAFGQKPRGALHVICHEPKPARCLGLIKARLDQSTRHTGDWWLREWMAARGPAGWWKSQRDEKLLPRQAQLSASL